MSAYRELNSYEISLPHRHDLASRARYGNRSTAFEETVRVIAWAYLEIYHISDENTAGELAVAHCYGLALDQLRR